MINRFCWIHLGQSIAGKENFRLRHYGLKVSLCFLSAPYVLLLAPHRSFELIMFLIMTLITSYVNGKKEARCNRSRNRHSSSHSLTHWALGEEKPALSVSKLIQIMKDLPVISRLKRISIYNKFMKYTEITTRHGPLQTWLHLLLTQDWIYTGVSYKSINIRNIAACTVLHQYQRDNMGT